MRAPPRSSHFNPRSLTGATQHRADVCGCRKDFNPRSLTGATRMTVTRRNCSAAFQSTLPHGSDPLMTLSQWETGISIHAPSRERPISSLSRAASSNFNPRSLTGATRDKAAYTCCPRHFNPRSLTGATRRKKKATPAFWISIHAPSRERPYKNRYSCLVG